MKHSPRKAARDRDPAGPGARLARAPSRNDVAWNLALDRSIPGKGGWTTCYQYATGLQLRLTMAGIANHVVIYNWNFPALGLQGCHAFVVYQDEGGRYWGVDNLSDRPRWLRGTTPPEWAAFWDADKTVRVLADLTPKKAPGPPQDGPGAGGCPRPSPGRIGRSPRAPGDCIFARAPQNAGMDKSQAAEVLDEIGTLLELKGENVFKTRAYRTAARALESLPDDLGRLVAEDRLGEVPGIGDAIREKLTELVTTGKLRYHDELKAQFPPGIFDVMQLPGLGPKKVKALYEQLQVSDIPSLEKACREQRVAGLAGFGAKTEANILLSIEQHRSYQDQHRAGDVMGIAEHLVDALREHPR